VTLLIRALTRETPAPTLGFFQETPGTRWQDRCTEHNSHRGLCGNDDEVSAAENRPGFLQPQEMLLAKTVAVVLPVALGDLAPASATGLEVAGS
jgi:hypothetical protein